MTINRLDYFILTWMKVVVCYRADHASTNWKYLDWVLSENINRTFDNADFYVYPGQQSCDFEDALSWLMRRLTGRRRGDTIQIDSGTDLSVCRWYRSKLAEYACTSWVAEFSKCLHRINCGTVMSR